jgi:hypothetical protein
MRSNSAERFQIGDQDCARQLKRPNYVPLTIYHTNAHRLFSFACRLTNASNVFTLTSLRLPSLKV